MNIRAVAQQLRNSGAARLIWNVKTYAWLVINDRVPLASALLCIPFGFARKPTPDTPIAVNESAKLSAE